MSRAACLFVLICCATAFAADADDERTLSLLNVKTERTAVLTFLDEVATGKRASLKKDEATALVAQLGSRDFAEREAATKKLKEPLFPPVAELEAAVKSGNPEQARRARQILSLAAARPDPIAAAVRLVRSKKWEAKLDQLIAVADVCATRTAAETLQDLLAERATPADEKAVRAWLTDKNPKRVAAGARVFPLISKAEVPAEVTKLLDHADEGVKFAAARGLLQRMDSVDFKTYKDNLSAEGYARLIAAAERDFRVANADKLKDEKAMAKYGKIVEQLIPALQACEAYKHEKKPGTNTDEWVKLGPDTSSKPEVLFYRVRWFSGQWSGWMTPGYGDMLMEGAKPDPRNIRCWACFGDHEYETIQATRPDQHRVIVDAKQ